MKKTVVWKDRLKAVVQEKVNGVRDGCYQLREGFIRVWVESFMIAMETFFILFAGCAVARGFATILGVPWTVRITVGIVIWYLFSINAIGCTILEKCFKYQEMYVELYKKPLWLSAASFTTIMVSKQIVGVETAYWLTVLFTVAVGTATSIIAGLYMRKMAKIHDKLASEDKKRRWAFVVKALEGHTITVNIMPDKRGGMNDET